MLVIRDVTPEEREDTEIYPSLETAMSAYPWLEKLQREWHEDNVHEFNKVTSQSHKKVKWKCEVKEVKCEEL